MAMKHIELSHPITGEDTRTTLEVYSTGNVASLILTEQWGNEWNDHYKQMIHSMSLGELSRLINGLIECRRTMLIESE